MNDLARVVHGWLTGRVPANGIPCLGLAAEERAALVELAPVLLLSPKELAVLLAQGLEALEWPAALPLVSGQAQV